jgi:hypothetical protein
MGLLRAGAKWEPHALVVRFGRRPKLTPHQRQEAIARREAGETLVDIARSYNVSHPTIMRLLPWPAAATRAGRLGGDRGGKHVIP